MKWMCKNHKLQLHCPKPYKFSTYSSLMHFPFSFEEVEEMWKRFANWNHKIFHFLHLVRCSTKLIIVQSQWTKKEFRWRIRHLHQFIFQESAFFINDIPINQDYLITKLFHLKPTPFARFATGNYKKYKFLASSLFPVQ